MIVEIDFPEPLAGEVTELARRQGKSVSELVVETMAKNSHPLAGIDAILAPMRARIAALGITEEEALEDFEREKHDIRAGSETAIADEVEGKKQFPKRSWEIAMEPVYQRMAELGITEDDAVEFFEREKHAMREEQRAQRR